MPGPNTGFSDGSLSQLSGDNEGGVKDVTFSFSAFGLPNNLAADFDLTATSTSPTVVAFEVLLAQPGITGGFHFTCDGPSKKMGGVMFNHAANLLSGTFTNAFIAWHRRRRRGGRAGRVQHHRTDHLHLRLPDVPNPLLR